MNFTLFKTTMKQNWVMLLIFFAVLAMYITIMTSMYNPDNMDAISAMFQLLPADVMKAFGFSDMIQDLTGFLASWLYGILMVAFPMVYSIILGNKLVAKMVDNGSFSYLLSTPNSRTKIIMTQGVYALLSIAVLFAAVFGLGVLSSSVLFPGLLDVGAFLKLNVTTMLVNMVVIMISFFFSCFFNEARLSLGFGAGIPIGFLLLNMLGGASADADILKKISIFGFYDPVELVKGSTIWHINLIYIGIVLILFAASVFVFKRKRLPL